MNKKILLFTIIVLIFSFVNVCAKENNLSVSYEDINKTDVITYEKDMLRQMKSLLGENKDNEVPKSINFENTVKVFKLEKIDSIEDIKSAINSKSYYYRVPLTVDSGYVYSTLKISDNKVVGYDTSMTFDKSINQVAYLFEPEIVNKIVEKNKLDYKDIVVLTVPPIKTDFLFIEDGEKSLVIPFASRPDFLKVENGKLYEFEEFAVLVNNLSKEISADENILDDKSGSGLIEKESVYSYSYIFFIIILVCSLLIFAKVISKKIIAK